jgi:DUF1009 family protein
MLALIAGQGMLPGILAAQADQPPMICALQGFEPDGLTPDMVFRIETLGTFLAALSAKGITEVCFAGAITRPVIDPAAIDAATLPLVPVLHTAIQSGDDSALRAVMGLFESHGFTIRAAHEIAPSLLPDAGILGQVQPTAQDETDAARGADIVSAMAQVDIGQACVVAQGQALAVEAVFGTDWMLASLRTRPAHPEGGLLFKAPKPGQDRRADLPTIGPATVRAVRDAGLRGIVVQAGGVMILDCDAVIRACDAAGLFLWVRA